MKGILKRTTAGWFIWYQVLRDEISSGYDSIPLLPDIQTHNLSEVQEIEFDVRVYPSGARYATLINENVLGCSYPDCICQGNEITNCKN